MGHGVHSGHCSVLHGIQSSGAVQLRGSLHSGDCLPVELVLTLPPGGDFAGGELGP